MQFLVVNSRALIVMVTVCIFSCCKWVGAPQQKLCNVSSEDATQTIHDSSFSWRQPTYTQMCTKQRQASIAVRFSASFHFLLSENRVPSFLFTFSSPRQRSCFSVLMLPILFRDAAEFAVPWYIYFYTMCGTHILILFSTRTKHAVWSHKAQLTSLVHS